jgi:hypothetical protein
MDLCRRHSLSAHSVSTAPPFRRIKVNQAESSQIKVKQFHAITHATPPFLPIDPAKTKTN